ncbi:carbonic anhydrase 2-like [Sitodiplosis mosellana]|uniref:carbonic anhydrase 2-like n=1 Tax=Sitodiplosis mosellana TaxID=263140 RepID=UPI0024443ACC|nr:carbonic anhydrase 2-like [Sitodiplosis mosellana]
MQPHLTGGLLDGRYIFEQMHFHWGENDNVGAEHTIDGKSYAMEVHLVHYNSKYGNFARALKYKDGLVVVAFLIQARGNAKNVLFSTISDKIQNIIDPQSKSTIDSDSLLWMSEQELDDNYFAYKGSLTTGAYNEVVTWIIYKSPVIVSTQQVAVFRDMLDTENKKITNNYRPIQMPEKPPKVIFVSKNNKH